MAKEQQVVVPAHSSIYVDNPEERELTIYFCEPDVGINEDTGILLLISGFGQQASSQQAQELREYFSDKHNLVTLQCAYFGEEFMQLSQSATFHFNVNALSQLFSEGEFKEIYDGQRVHVDKLVEIGNKYDASMIGYEQLNETLHHFNDMGIMQALDNLMAVYVVESIMKDNKLRFNANRIMVYGQGHGAYLAFLCNAFAPQLFSCMVDDSAWLFPTYIKDQRMLTQVTGNLKMSTVFDYLVRKIEYDEEILYLPELYKKFENHCRIFSFPDKEEDIEGILQKRSFCQSVKLCHFHEEFCANVKLIVDRIIRECTTEPMNRIEIGGLMLPTTHIQTKDYKYTIDFSIGVPVLARKSKRKHTELFASSKLH